MSSPAPWNDARTRLTNAALGMPIAWPNERFDMPNPTGLWAAVEMTGQSLAPIEIGNGVWQETGRLYVHVMTPTGWGTDDARALGKTIATTFRGLPGAPMVYLSASIGDGSAEDEDGAWWRLTVTVEWRYQDILS